MIEAREMRRLLRACRRGDERAARSLHALMAPAMHAYARAILRDAALADDAVQGVFLAVLRQPVRTVLAVGDPAAWLTRLVRREALMMARSASRARRREAMRAGAERYAGPPGETDRLGVEIERLPRQLREVLTLRHVCGLTFDQIELATGVNRNTASARHRKALSDLRARMDPAGDAREAPVAPRTPPIPQQRSSAHA